MNGLIVLAHHEPRSFNAALSGRAADGLRQLGHQVRVSDLYAMRFDPVSDRRNFAGSANPDYLKQQAEEMHASSAGGLAPDLEREIEKLEWCDLLILQFPLWWFGVPAILKGWFDRVLVMGRVYGRGRWYDAGAFAGKRAMLSLTTGGPRERFGTLNPSMEDILRPIEHGVLWFNGFSVLPAFVSWGVARVDDRARRAELDRFEHHLARALAEPGRPPPRVADHPMPSSRVAAA